jgi:hypothetical protein
VWVSGSNGWIGRSTDGAKTQVLPHTFFKQQMVETHGKSFIKTTTLILFSMELISGMNGKA